MSDERPTFALSDGFLGLPKAKPGKGVAVAGIPMDIGTTNRAGARFGPRAIRQASLMLVDGAHPVHRVGPELGIADIGDCEIARGDTPASLALIEKQAAPLAHLLALGGEHGVTLGLLRALAKK